jgi:predicted nucleic acid-binding protein
VITAVDTSVLLDVFGADPTFGSRSRAAVRSCAAEGSLVASDVVWVEVASYFESGPSAEAALGGLGVEFSATSVEAALAAGTAWKAYRARGGKRTRVVADFLIGAHALSQTERLLTRDRGFYRAYFAPLKIVDPAESG